MYCIEHTFGTTIQSRQRSWYSRAKSPLGAINTAIKEAVENIEQPGAIVNVICVWEAGQNASEDRPVLKITVEG